MRTCAILPVKPFVHAKRRLEAALSRSARRALAEAMFTDVLTALRHVEAIDEIVVVSADPGAQRIAARYGARALDDPAGGGLDEAILRGTSFARELGAAQVLCVAGDTPLLDPLELDALLGMPRAAERYAAIVADRHGTGTNGLLLSPADALPPSYGPGSLERHRGLAQAAGVPMEVAQLASLALDVDTPDDLATLRERLAACRNGAACTRVMLQRL